VKEVLAHYHAVAAGSTLDLPDSPCSMPIMLPANEQLRAAGTMNRSLLEKDSRRIVSLLNCRRVTKYRCTEFPRARQHFHIAQATTDVLRNLAREEDASLFMVLATAFGILLHRYTIPRRFDWSCRCNRKEKALESLIGLFVNTIIVRGVCRRSDSKASCAMSARTFSAVTSLKMCLSRDWWRNCVRCAIQTHRHSSR